jgi:hypothetical protein
MVSETPIDTIGYPIKEAFKICKHSSNDTSFYYFFKYNNKCQLIKYEKIEKGSPINYFYTYDYDSFGKRQKEEQHIVFTFQKNNSFPDQKTWARDVIKIYFKDQGTFEYDSIFGKITINYGLRAITKKRFYDTIFINKKIALIMDSKDTITTYEYDNKGRLIKEYNFGEHKNIKKFKYKKNKVVSLWYDLKTKELFKTETSIYDLKNQLIERDAIIKVKLLPGLVKWYRFKKHMDYFCRTYYSYKDNRLIKYQEESYLGDNSGECHGEFIEIYKY